MAQQNAEFDWKIGRDESMHPAVTGALQDCRRAFWSVAAFSAAVNILMLAGPLYMLQVYDRVLSSRSVPTLLGLSLLLVGAYAFQGLFDFLRTRIVVHGAALLDRRLMASVHAAVLRISVRSRRIGLAQQPLRDLDQIRSFLNGSGPIAIVDMPWIPVYLAICFLVHPVLGMISLMGGATLVLLTFLTERYSRGPARQLAQAGSLRAGLIDSHCRNSEAVMAMGMEATLGGRWTDANRSYVAAIGGSSDVVNAFGSLSKAVRMLLQSGILGIGAYLVIYGQMSAGSMIAASIMMGRALAPIETAIANWRSFVSAREGVKRLSFVLSRILPATGTVALPAPKSSLDVSHLWAGPPASADPIIRDIDFKLVAGEAVGVIGPSGAGKSSLARALVGIWPPARGTIRIDGATLDQWDAAALGPSVGYMGQPAELFEGSVAENIARMKREFDPEGVFRAARAAGAHEMILGLPNGYNAAIGEAGVALSAGQRQRIALARALFGDPFLVVLDEPHANLDTEGAQALTDAILAAKRRGAIVVLVAHRPSELMTCDKVLILGNGIQHAFGGREEVLRQTGHYRGPSAVPSSPEAIEMLAGVQR